MLRTRSHIINIFYVYKRRRKTRELNIFSHRTINIITIVPFGILTLPWCDNYTRISSCSVFTWRYIERLLKNAIYILIVNESRASKLYTQ